MKNLLDSILVIYIHASNSQEIFFINDQVQSWDYKNILSCTPL